MAIKTRSWTKNERALSSFREIARSSPQIAAVDQIKRDASSIADTMRRIYGGVWSITIDHEEGVVLILRQSI